MQFDDIKSVNKLFEKLYPYIAKQILDAYGREEGSVLEIGPYSPGISIALARLCDKLRFVIGDDSSEINQYLRELIAAAGLTDRVDVKEVDKFNLPFDDGSFDLTIFRGALFFWENGSRIMMEMYRVLKPGGLGVAGGGFGVDTPEELINEVGERSRELNRRLQKRVLSETEVDSLIEQAGLAGYTELERRHGLWVIMRK